MIDVTSFDCYTDDCGALTRTSSCICRLDPASGTGTGTISR